MVETILLVIVVLGLLSLYIYVTDSLRRQRLFVRKTDEEIMSEAQGPGCLMFLFSFLPPWR